MSEIRKSKIGFSMSKRQITMIAAASAAVILALAIFVGYTINSVENRARRICFDELEVASKQLADELYMAVSSDHTALSAIGNIIAGQDDFSDKDLCQVIGSYDVGTTYISSLMLLKPDNTMLFADGSVIDVSGDIEFAKEVEKEEYLSGVRQSIREPSIKVVEHSVTIVKNGETLYILYGIVELTDLANRYKTGLYDGNAYVYIEDGDSGDFILDTWHKTQGNILDLGKRKMLPGYSLEQAIDDMSHGSSGEIAFISQTTGNVLYMRYEPLGINNWNVMVTVEEDHAFAHSNAITQSLYLMAEICGVILLLYFIFIVLILIDAYKQVKRMGSEDQNTELLNRNAYEQYIFDKRRQLFPNISCVYMDANGLHELNNTLGHAEGDRMLRTVADALRKEFEDKYVFRIGGDEFVAFSETDDSTTCTERVARIMGEVESCGYSISVGIANCRDEMGLSRIAKDADALMLENKRQYYKEHDRRRQ